MGKDFPSNSSTVCMYLHVIFSYMVLPMAFLVVHCFTNGQKIEISRESETSSLSILGVPSDK